MHSLFIPNLGFSAIDLHDAFIDNALCQVLIRRPDTNLLYTFIASGQLGGSRKRIICFKLDHRPHDYTHRRERFFERMKLRKQCSFYTGTCLVSRPEIVAEGLDDMISSDADVCRAVLDHLGDHMEHASDSAEGRIGFLEAPDSVEVAKQFVSAVDEVNDHF